MIAKKDADHVVRGTAFNISGWAKKTEKETLDALQILASPDTKRLEPQPNEGRRIERVEDGWLILNGQYYENLMRKANRREYKTGWQRDKRSKEKATTVLPKSNPLPGETAAIKGYQNGTRDEHFETIKPSDATKQPHNETIVAKSETKAQERETATDSGLKVTRAFE